MRMLTREWVEVFPDAKPLTQPQAHRMLRDYDTARETARTQKRREPSLREWIERTIGNAPGPGCQRGVLKHEWRTAS